ncbi:MlaD family protein [Nocardia brasiliensis]|uniref:MlaD family protein n=1 Tax=Nocardia brasiliensis TaxID=37326 RepID=UPI00378A51E0
MSGAHRYVMPGVHITPRSARLTGLVALVAVVCAAIALTTFGNTAHEQNLRVRLRTDVVGDGVVAGTSVRFDGVQVGRVTAVDPAANGRQVLSVELDRAQVAELTDAASVDYAPANLFGITAVALRSGTGGQPLRDGSLLDLTGRTSDHTMANLLRSLTETSGQVLTPQLTALLTQVGTDLRAFTPILQAMVTLGRIAADTERYRSSYLIEQYAGFLHGTGEFASSTFVLLHSVLGIDAFVTDRPGYDAGVAMVADQLIPSIGTVLDTAHTQLGGYADIATPLLSAIASTVPTPDRSHAELTELLTRLDRIFADTGQGPRVQVAVTLRTLPGLAVPLLGQSMFTDLTGAQAGPR